MPLEKFYAQAVIIDSLLKTIVPNSQWSKRLDNLFTEYPTVDITIT